MTLIKSLRSLAGLLRYLPSNALDLVLVLVVVPTSSGPAGASQEVSPYHLHCHTPLCGRYQSGFLFCSHA